MRSSRNAMLLDPSSLPNIPVEMWQRILSFAVSVPDPLLRPQRTAGKNDVHDYELCHLAVERHRKSMVIKRKLVTVCRQWNAMATPLLYEHISLKSDKKLKVLLRSMGKRPTIHGAQDDRTLGSLVRRLDLDIYPLRWIGSGRATPSTPAKLMGNLPNLSTLVFNSHDDSKALRSFAFSEILPPQLEFFYSRNTLLLPILETIQLLQSQPRLSYFEPPYLDLETPEAKHEVEVALAALRAQKLSFPALRELICDWPDQCRAWIYKLPAGTFPNLQRATFVFEPTIEDLKEFLSSHGASLSAIQLNAGAIGVGHWLPLWLECLEEFCPHLQELVVAIEDIGAIRPESNLPPPSRMPASRLAITTLGVSMYTEDFGDYHDVRDLLNNVLSWAKHFGRLEQIILMDEQNVDAARKYEKDAFDLFLKICRSRKLKVFDQFGACLNV